MHIARIQDSNNEEPIQQASANGRSSLQAVTDALHNLALPPKAPDFIEHLFRHGYAVVRIDALPPNVIFKGRQV